MTTTRKKVMVVNRRAPHGTIYPLELLEVVLISSAFDQDISLAFIDDGVYQLMKNQDTQGIGIRNFSLAFRALEDHDVRTLYVESDSLQARGLTAADLMLPVTIVSAAELGDIMAQQDTLLSA